MIVVYPMLTSSNVNPNIIPGLAKAIEKYTLVYNTDDILRVVNGSLATAFKIAAPLIISAGTIALAPKIKQMVSKFNEGDQLIEIGKRGSLGGSNRGRPPYKGNQNIKSTLPYSQPSDEEDSKDTQKPQQIKRGISKVEVPKAFSETLSLEPTWIQLNTDFKGLQLLGVKVVPFIIESSTPIIDLMMSDANLKNWSFQAQKFARKVPRVIFKFMRALRIPGIKDKALTGDPKKDIIYGTTGHGRSMFLTLSNLDMEQSSMFSNPNVVRRLQKLGWASFVITDDVNKNATFCMKEFGGICSQSPYSYIMASQGKTQHEVYKDLEDVKRSAGPFFRMSTNRKKMFSEAAVANRYKSFRNLLD
ncbi:MAG: hypothetical protein ACTSX1_09320 [Candidatus Heimdallarchaeaceae archaeon]